MSILAQFLFGSYARRDFNENSDVDILCVTEETWQRNSSEGKINISFYPKYDFLKASSQGDLFILHIIKEAKTLYDPNSLHHLAERAFQYKNTYQIEIRNASELGWFLIKNWNKYHPSPDSNKIFNKRMAWCVRTILIALSVQNHKPKFDAYGLSEISGSEQTLSLLSHKDDTTLSVADLAEFERIIIQFGTNKLPFYLIANTNTSIKYFESKNNQVAVKTLRQLFYKSIYNKMTDKDY